ncbi:MAG: TIM barrel protein [Lentisphaerae bacterium]|nr:TIM barrel protein [Lentisphaerota bacterium]
MSSGKLHFCVNLTMLFSEVPFLGRFEQAAKAGFSDVEFLFPYSEGVGNIKSRITDLGLNVVLFDVPPGNMQKGEFGTLCLPHRGEYFRQSFETALDAAEQLHCKRLNVLFGNRVTNLPLEAQMDCAIKNLQWALPLAEKAGIILLLEPLSGMVAPTCMLQSTETAMRVIRTLNHPHLKLQYDFFHAQINEGNLIRTMTVNFDYIGHIQIADAPDRHEPGTGEINYKTILAKLIDLNYRGFIGLEYAPSGSSLESLAWLRQQIKI